MYENLCPLDETRRFSDSTLLSGVVRVFLLHAGKGLTAKVPAAIFNRCVPGNSCYDRGMKKLIVLSLVLLFSASAFAQPHHHHRHHHRHHRAR
jgi:hypothetical protein